MNSQHIIALTDEVDSETNYTPKDMVCDFEHSTFIFPNYHSGAKQPVCLVCGVKYYHTKLADIWIHPFHDNI